jgi:excisionase family DNA binding protein
MSDLARALIDTLDESGLALLAERLGPYLQPMLERTAEPNDSWLDSHAAADYLGITLNSLYKLTADRAIPFEQDGPGCKAWFRRSALDAWREAGGAPSYTLRSP